MVPKSQHRPCVRAETQKKRKNHDKCTLDWSESPQIPRVNLCRNARRKTSAQKIWENRFGFVWFLRAKNGSSGLLLAWMSATIGSVGILPGFLPKLSLLALRNVKVRNRVKRWEQSAQNCAPQTCVCDSYEPKSAEIGGHQRKRAEKGVGTP